MLPPRDRPSRRPPRHTHRLLSESLRYQASHRRRRRRNGAHRTVRQAAPVRRLPDWQERVQSPAGPRPKAGTIRATVGNKCQYSCVFQGKEVESAQGKGATIGTCSRHVFQIDTVLAQLRLKFTDIKRRHVYSGAQSQRGAGPDALAHHHAVGLEPHRRVAFVC